MEIDNDSAVGSLDEEVGSVITEAGSDRGSEYPYDMDDAGPSQGGKSEFTVSGGAGFNSGKSVDVSGKGAKSIQLSDGKELSEGERRERDAQMGMFCQHLSTMGKIKVENDGVLFNFGDRTKVSGDGATVIQGNAEDILKLKKAGLI